MKNDKVYNQEIKAQNNQNIAGHILPMDEKKRLTDFFSLLIEIDQRIRKEKKYGNIRNTNSAN